MTAHLDELLERDLAEPFSDDEVDLLRAAGPERLPITLRKLADLFDHVGCQPIPEFAYTLARFKSRPEEPVSADQLDLDLALLRLLPLSLDHYRQAAEEVRSLERLFAADVRHGR
jgi:hypothetical protein